MMSRAEEYYRAYYDLTTHDCPELGEVDRDIIIMMEGYVADELKEMELDKAVHRYTIDCWYKDNVSPKVKYIYAINEDQAESLFKKQNPDMDCDPPYIFE